VHYTSQVTERVGRRIHTKFWWGNSSRNSHCEMDLNRLWGWEVDGTGSR